MLQTTEKILDITFENLQSLDARNVHFRQDDALRFLRVEEKHFWFHHRRKVLLNLLRSLVAPDAKGLDLGCGSGFTTERLAETGYTMVGLDAFTPPLAESRQTRALFRVGDIFSSSVKEEFDFVLLLDVLEHIPDDRKFLEKALQTLKPGGIVVVTVPSFSWLWTEIDTQSGHLRRYTLKTLKNAFPSTVPMEYATFLFLFTFPLYGLSRLRFFFRKKSSEPVSTELFLSPITNAFCGLLCWMESRVLNFFPLPLGSSLLVVHRKPQT